ncbi:MAG: autotransporter-associated beta strand repeat-containing protein, partial [Planctomycetes bacterium]|nr:autotransporter-associated beta strand repeat-containing protein [Planctomycetota bacterium]
MANDRWWDPDGTGSVSGGTNNWNTTNNFWSTTSTGSGWTAWRNSGTGAADVANFISGSGTLTLTTGITVRGLLFSSGPYLVTGNTLTLSNTGSGSVAGGEVQVTGSNSAEIASILAGTAGMIKSGTGTLTLSGASANTYTGTTSVNGGVLALNKTGVNAIIGNITVGDGAGNDVLRLDNSNQIIDTAVLTFNGTGANAGIFRLNAFNETVAGIASTGGAGVIENGGATDSVLTINNSGAQSFAGVIQDGSGAGLLNLSKLGAGTLTLSGTSSTYSGTTTISAGILQAAGSGSLGDGSASNTLIFAGGTLQATGTITSPSTRGITLSSTGLIDTNSQSITLAGVISGANGLTKSGAGTLTLSGASTYTGVTTVSAGTLAFGTIANRDGTASALGAPTSAANGTIALGAATLQYTGSGDTTNRVVNLTGAGTIDASGSGTLTFDNDATSVITATAQNLTLTGSGNGTINSPIATTTGTLTKTGTGTWTLAGTNTFTGAVTISDGTLSIPTITNAATNGTLGASANVPSNLFLNGGTLQYTGGDVSTDRLFAVGSSGGTIDASGSGAINFNNTGSMGFNSQTGARTITLTGSNTGANTISAVIGNNSGATSLIKSGTGSWTLSGTNTYTGTTTISAGTLAAGSTSSLGTGAASNTLVFAGGTLQATGTITSPSTRGVTLNSTGLIDTNGNSVSIAGVVNGANGLTKNGAGTLTLTGTNTFSGPVQVSNGTLSIASINNSGNSSLGTNTVVLLGSSGKTGALQFTGASGSTTRGFLLATGGTGAFDVTGTNTLTLGGLVSGSGAFSKTGTGMLVLSNTANSYSGGTTISAGTLAAAASGSLGDGSATNALIFAGGTLQATGVITSPSTRGVTMTGTGIIDTNGNSMSIAGLIDGAGGLTKNGTGTLTLTNTNTFAGTVAINSGTLSVASIADGGAASGLGAGGTIGIGSAGTVGTLQYTGGSVATNRAVALGAAGGVIDGGGATLTMSGPFSGGPLTKSGAGTLILTNAGNSYSGGTTVSTGTLRLGASNAMPNAPLSVAAAFDLNGFNGGVTTLALANGTVTGAGTLTLGGTVTSSGVSDISGGTLALGGNRIFSVTETLNVGSLITGVTNTLTKTGAGTMVLANSASSFSGAVTVSAGTVSIPSIANGAVNSPLGSSAAATAVSLGSSGNTGTIQFNGGTGSSDRTFSLVTGGVGEFDVPDGNDLTLSGVISGGGAFSKIGGGTLNLGTTASTFSGAATIANGTVVIGSLANSGNGPLGNSSAKITLGSSGANGTLRFTGASGATDRNITLAAGGAGVIDLTTTGSTLTYTGVISGSGDLYKTGPGTLAFANTSVTSNSFSGTAYLYEGLVTLNQPNNDISDGPISGNLVVGDGIHSVEVRNQTDGQVFNVKSVTVNQYGLYNLNNHGEGIKSITVNGGAVTTGSGTLTLRETGTGIFSDSSPATGTISGKLALERNNTPTVIADGASPIDLQISAKISDDDGATPSGLNKSGAGVLELTGTNTYTGSTTIGESTLALGTGGSISSGSPIQFRGGVFAKSGTFTRNLGPAADNNAVNWGAGGGGFAAYGGALSVDIGGTSSSTWGATANFVPSGSPLMFGSPIADNVVTYTDSINLGTSGTNTREIFADDNTLSSADYAVISGNLTSTGGTQSLSKTGAGILELSGAGNTYNGTTTISAGTLRLAGGANRLYSSGTNANSDVSISSGAIFDLNGTSQTIDDLTGAGGVTLNAGSLTVGNSNGSSTFSGAISTTGTLTKAGSG